MNHYYGLSINELKELAYHLAKKLALEYPSSWDQNKKAGRKWYHSFMERHSELLLRTPEQTSIDRVKGFCKTNLDRFFDNLGRLMDEYHFESHRIYNMAELGFSTNLNKIGEMIEIKGLRRAGQLEATEHGTMITMARTVCASGNVVSHFFLFPRKNMQGSFLDNVPDGIVGFANDSGWMQQPEFARYIRHFIWSVRPSRDEPVLLLLDSHAAHLSVEALDFAAANGVHILSALQP